MSNIIDKIIKECNLIDNSIILYTIVDNNLAKYLANTSGDKKIPCFGVLGKSASHSFNIGGYCIVLGASGHDRTGNDQTI